MIFDLKTTIVSFDVRQWINVLNLVSRQAVNKNQSKQKNEQSLKFSFPDEYDEVISSFISQSSQTKITIQYLPHNTTDIASFANSLGKCFTFLAISEVNIFAHVFVFTRGCVSQHAHG